MSYIYACLLYSVETWFWNRKSLANNYEIFFLSTGIFLFIHSGYLLEQESFSVISVWEGLASKLYLGWFSWSWERGDMIFLWFAHSLLLQKKTYKLIHLCLTNLDTGRVGVWHIHEVSKKPQKKSKQEILSVRRLKVKKRKKKSELEHLPCYLWSPHNLYNIVQNDIYPINYHISIKTSIPYRKWKINYENTLVMSCFSPYSLY